MFRLLQKEIRNTKCGIHGKQRVIWMENMKFLEKLKHQVIKKSRKDKFKHACGLMTENITGTHTNASNHSYEHPPRP